MDICVIGDSHTVALKQGLPAVEGEFPDCNIVFFGGHGDSLNDLTVADGKLVPGSHRLQRLFKITSEGEESIAPRYDVYLLAGVALRLFGAARLCIAALQRQAKTGEDVTLSDDELFRLIHSAFAKTIANDVMTKLRQISDAPAFLIATPYPGQSADTQIWKRLKKSVPLDRLENAYNTACETLCAAHGVRFLRQPAETIARNGVTTWERYTRGATAEIERVSDDTHMNAEFGAIVLRDALREILKSRKNAA